MSYIEITKFCANKHEVRTGLHHPYRIGPWVYATNGHMIVRVPSESAPHIPEYDKKSQPSNPPAMFEKWLEQVQGEFLCLPTFPPSDRCFMCGGTGELHGDECFNCFGSGFEFTYQPMGDGVGFSLHYLNLIAELPQCRIRTNGLFAAAFIFDGGQGLLMPMLEKARR